MTKPNSHRLNSAPFWEEVSGNAKLLRPDLSQAIEQQGLAVAAEPWSKLTAFALVTMALATTEFRKRQKASAFGATHIEALRPWVRMPSNVAHLAERGARTRGASWHSRGH